MAWEIRSVGVIGAGAIGLYYGGRLAAAGENVRFLLRSDLDAVRRGGIQVESVRGDFSVPRAQGFGFPEEIGPVDLVIVAWKATANHLLGNVLPPMLHDRTRVLTLQNGLGNCEEIARWVPAQHVLGGLCFVCCNRDEPGKVKHTAGGRISIGSWRGSHQDAAQIAAMLRKANVPVDAAESLERAQWEKLVWNIPFNGLSVAEGGKTTEQLLAQPRIEAEIRALMREVITAARAQELPLADTLIEANIERTRPMAAYRTSSMIDFVEGRDVEIGPIWEEPLRRGRAAGVAMPRLANLLERIRQRIAERTKSETVGRLRGRL